MTLDSAKMLDNPMFNWTLHRQFPPNKYFALVQTTKPKKWHHAVNNTYMESVLVRLVMMGLGIRKFLMGDPSLPGLKEAFVVRGPDGISLGADIFRISTEREILQDNLGYCCLA